MTFKQEMLANLEGKQIWVREGTVRSMIAKASEHYDYGEKIVFVIDGNRICLSGQIKTLLPNETECVLHLVIWANEYKTPTEIPTSVLIL